MENGSKDYEGYVSEALRLADRAHHWYYGDGGDVATGMAFATEAQVYATLALAEATRLRGRLFGAYEISGEA